MMLTEGSEKGPLTRDMKNPKGARRATESMRPVRMSFPLKLTLIFFCRRKGAVMRKRGIRYSRTEKEKAWYINTMPRSTAYVYNAFSFRIFSLNT
jgi:hypothetical protein